ncbi:MAG: 16S rRNA (cytidine(1402)-2'-O)-methyltransferase [Desulfobacterales bacterium]|nr:16S rRNA (cytidine(1402)-2'-O)-methyltransferase [Desulfobacterales bacterium]
MNFGTLYITATPLGNLEDMTYRAVRILEEVDLIAAEDTRHSKRLLNHYGIATPCISCHEHNESKRTPQLIQRLTQGESIALITDAGTPCISDPGFHLVREASAQGITVVPVPGCSAAVAGLSVSGLPTDRFAFFGFPPRKAAQQRKALEELKSDRATQIFYESPRRILALLTTLAEVFGDRQACLAREITKRHEEYIRGPLSQIIAALEERDTVKGECALFVEGAGEAKAPSSEELETLVQERLNADPDAPTSSLSKELAAEFKVPKKKIYNLILKLKE